jgi:WD40 repeat protein
VMVGAFGEVLVMDWGLAKVLPRGGIADEERATLASRGCNPPGPIHEPTVIQTARSGTGSETLAGSVMGTPAFMSPEQAAGEIDKLDERADVFGLGAVLCVILTGQPPFVADSGEAVRLMAVRGELSGAFTRLDGCGVDAELVGLCKRCLSADRDRRPRHAGEVAGAVSGYLAGVEERAQRAELDRARTEVRHAEERKRRKVQLVLAGAVVMLLLVSGFGAGLTSLWQTAERARSAAESARDGEEQAKQRAEVAREMEENAKKAAVDLSTTLKNALGATQEAFTQLDHLKYVRSIDLAHREWEKGNAVRARQLLADNNPAHRNWEWHFCDRLFHPACLVLNGPRSLPTDVRFSHDGQQVLSISRDGDFRVWDRTTGMLISETSLQLSPFSRAKMSPDGTRAVSFATGPEPQVWDLRSKKPIATYRGHRGYAYQGQFNASGEQVITGGKDGFGHIWDAATGKEIVRVQHLNPAMKSAFYELDAVGFDGTGSRAFTADSFAINVWDARTGQLMRSFRHADGGYSDAVALSADGLRLAVFDTMGDGRIWDVATSALVADLRGHRMFVRQCAFSADGKLLASIGQDYVRIWEVASGRTLHSLKGHTRDVTALAFSPDGSRVVTGSVGSEIRVWELPSERPREASPIAAIAFSRDGTLVTFGTNHVVRTMEVRTDRILHSREFPNMVPGGGTIALSPDGTLLATRAKEAVVLVNTATGQTVEEFPVGTGIYARATFSPDAKRVAVLDRSNLTIWDLALRKSVWSTNTRPATLERSAFSPDGTRVAALDSNAKARVWDARTGDLQAEFLVEKYIRELAFTPDGKRLATRADRVVKIWDVATGTAVSSITGHVGDIYTIAFSPDGSRLVTGSNDRSLRVWDVRTGQEVLNLVDEEAQSVWSAAFSPDGTRLAIGRGNGTVRIYDATPRIETVPPPRPVKQ